MSRPVRQSMSIAVQCLCVLLAWPQYRVHAAGRAGPASEPPLVRAGPEAFSGYNPRMQVSAFDLITADFDLDGDPDLLINWHHRGPLELFENREGVYRPVDAGDGSRSGLVENADAPGLFRDAAEAEAAAETHGEPGLYLWHDAARMGAWQFLWTDPRDSFGGCTLHLSTSVRIREVSGLEPSDVEVEDERRRTLRIPPGTPRRRFAVTTEPIGVRLEVRLEARPDAGEGLRPALFAGVPPRRQARGRAALWKPDPHGMAWVDVEGTPHPELFVTRGGLSGQLQPPAAPKTDRYYTGGGGAIPFRLTERRVPPDYGRGRAVEWVDVDNDGRLELSIANEGGANALLVRTRDGKFVDRAQELGIDIDAATQCWSDADGDGYQDLFYLDPDGVKILLNRGGERFAPADAERFEMALPPLDPRPGGDDFDRAVLRLADFDADGDLDLWVLARGPRRGNHLFLREGAGFRDGGATVGFGAVARNDVTVLADLDNDGYEDMVVLGPAPALWLNERAERLRRVEPGLPRHATAGSATDVNRDGKLDLVLAGSSRYLFENRMPGAGGSFEVTLRDPRGSAIGAVVTALYEDGRRVARRLGSDRTAYSQHAGPLRFATDGTGGPRRVEVRWPGDRAGTLFELPGGPSAVVLERNATPAE